MRDFSSLEFLLKFDYTQMRGWDTGESGDKRATDEAIIEFVKRLNDFFIEDCKEDPSIKDCLYYDKIMTEILKKINQAEYNYYYNRYLNDPELGIKATRLKIKQIAECMVLTTYASLPTRMQYWAAGESFGDTIRNAQEHKKAIISLDKWSALVAKEIVHTQDVVPEEPKKYKRR